MITTGRREFLCAAGGASATLAGCLRDTGGGPESGSGKSPPVVDRPLPEAYTAEELADNLLSGGPGKDGIPSVDSPSFAPADEAPEQLQPQDPVFGVERNGKAKAYPQYILVHHEIVNDVIAGDPVAVTYCPLTGTTQGFERGGVEFGVSDQPINSNLVMYDRGTESHWPQMLARGITGPHAGDYLREFQVVWTTGGAGRRLIPVHQSSPNRRVLPGTTGGTPTARTTHETDTTRTRGPCSPRSPAARRSTTRQS